MELEHKSTFLLLGSNLGNRAAYLQEAIVLIAKQIGKVVSKSDLYETAAWGKTDQPGFLNQAVEVATGLTPLEVLHGVLNIEKTLGRVRDEKWGARVIDIDVILYGNEVVAIANELQIPHPEMQNRKFVLAPLAQIAPNVIHPILKQSISEILKESDDPLVVKKYESALS